jgi:hypothetical protein
VFFLAVNEGAPGVVATFVAHDAASTVQDRIYMSPLETLSLVEEPVAVFDAPRVTVGRHAQEIAVSADLTVARIGGGDIVVADGRSVIDAFTATGLSGGYSPAAEGDHVVFAEVEAAWRLMHWTPETGTDVYYDPPDDIGDPLLDAGTLVWIRYADFVDGLATRAELWTAPFVRNPADLTPRMVHPRVEPSYAHLGGGVYGWMGAPEVHLVDIDSGRERLLMPPPGTDCADLLYVSSTDVAINCVELATGAQVIYRLDPRVVATDAPAPRARETSGFVRGRTDGRSRPARWRARLVSVHDGDGNVGS